VRVVGFPQISTTGAMRRISSQDEDAAAPLETAGLIETGDAPEPSLVPAGRPRASRSGPRPASTPPWWHGWGSIRVRRSP
jgi:hypothetical protein